MRAWASHAYFLGRRSARFREQGEQAHAYMPLFGKGQPLATLAVLGLTRCVPGHGATVWGAVTVALPRALAHARSRIRRRRFDASTQGTRGDICGEKRWQCGRNGAA